MFPLSDEKVGEAVIHLGPGFRLAFTNTPSCVSASPHFYMRMKMDPVSETCSV
jgi:hypothetical protein